MMGLLALWSLQRQLVKTNLIYLFVAESDFMLRSEPAEREDQLAFPLQETGLSSEHPRNTAAACAQGKVYG